MKRTKRLTALLCLILAAASVATSSVFATDTDFEGVETGEVLDYEPAPEEFVNGSDSSEQNELAANEVGAMLGGNLPHGAQISTSNLSKEEYPDDIGEFVDNQSDVVGAFDLTVHDKNGDEWQPATGERIVVTLNAADYGLSEGDEVCILHKHEGMNTESLGRYVVTDGVVTFTTASFSKFLLVTGEVALQEDSRSTWIDFSAGKNVTVYLGPNDNKAWSFNTSYYLQEASDPWNLSSYNGSTSAYSYGTGTENVGKYIVYNVYNSAATVYYCQFTIRFVEKAFDDFYIMDPTNEWGSVRYCYVMNGTSFKARTPGNATMTWTGTNKGWGTTNSWSTNAWSSGISGIDTSTNPYYILQCNGVTMYIYVVDHKGIAKQALLGDAVCNTNGDLAYSTGTNPTFAFRCLTNPNSGLPSEPVASTGRSYATISHSYTTSSNINSSISSLMTYASGYAAIGYTQSTGTIKSYMTLTDDQWQSALLSFAQSGTAVYGVDGVQVTASNYKNYLLIPYSLKFLPTGSYSTLGWYLDCYIAPVATLTYDLNLGGKTPASTISTPGSFTSILEAGGTWDAATVSGTPAVGSQHTMTNGEIYTFLGWATTSDAVASNVTSNASYTVSHSSPNTLYGVWEQVILNFSLKINVSGVDMELDDEQCFVFRLQGVTTEDETIDLIFVVYGEGTTTIAELPHGNYAVSGSDWAWRYDNVTGTGGVYDFGGLSEDTSLTYQVSRSETKWLDANSYVSMPTE